MGLKTGFLALIGLPFPFQAHESLLAGQEHPSSSDLCHLRQADPAQWHTDLPEPWLRSAQVTHEPLSCVVTGIRGCLP